MILGIYSRLLGLPIRFMELKQKVTFILEEILGNEEKYGIRRKMQRNCHIHVLASPKTYTI